MSAEDPVPATKLLGATFATWGRALPWLAPAIAVLCAPAIALLVTRGPSWGAAAAGLLGEALAWSIAMPRAVAAARGRPGGSLRAGLVAAPRVVVALAIAYAPVLLLILSIQLGHAAMSDLLGRWITIALVLMVLPLAALLLAIELQAQWIVLVPLLVDAARGRGLGLRAAQAMTHVFWYATTFAWLIVSTLRASLAAASYVAIRDRVTPADLGRVFE